MKWTIRHYYPFGPASKLTGESLLSVDAWERLRISQASGGAHEAFHLPETRADWLRLCDGSAAAARSAADIAAIVQAGQYDAVFSVGVGRACLERHLKNRLPQVRLTCAEYSPGVVARLREVFVECDEILLFDLLAGVWPPLTARSLVLLNRVDTELDDAQWRRVFRQMSDARVTQIMLVVTGFITPRTVAREGWVRLVSRLRRSPLTFAGYTRTKSRLADLWQPYYRVASESTIGDLTGFLLSRMP